jgi:hypothetical protein
MEKYNIANLIIFWNKQRQLDFKDIITVLDIIDDCSPEDLKLDKILDVLTAAGLKSESHRDEVNKRLEKQGIFKIEEGTENQVIVPIDLIDLELMQGQKVKAIVFLN